jgi:hypothetical protein
MAAEMASEAEEADVNAPTAGMTAQEVELLRSKRGRKCRVWARRVWTLELSLVSMAEQEEVMDILPQSS